jgi:hypothetical protein
MPGFSAARSRSAVVFGLIALLCAGRADADDFEIHSNAVVLSVSLSDRLSSDDEHEPWRTWLTSGLGAATLVTGSFPRDRVVVDIDAATRGSSPVVFGRVRRSRPPRLQLWVSPDARPEALAEDWHIYHEFAHLLIPFPGNRDIWFTEGLASYYQHLVQARAGVIPPQQAWRELLAGFERGRSDPAGRGRTLRSLSPEMWRERAFKRVYWTGAAFFLRVDVRLRAESGGRHSLDTALAAFHRCCLGRDRARDREQDWNARALVEALGRSSIAEIWRQEYFRTIDSEAVPRPGNALERLGIRGVPPDLHFDPRIPARKLRTAIAGPRVQPLAQIEP